MRPTSALRSRTRSGSAATTPCSCCGAGMRATEGTGGLSRGQEHQRRRQPVRRLGPGRPEPAAGRATPAPTCTSHYREDEMVANLRVCTNCGHHFPVTARERIVQLADEGTFTEIARGLHSDDPLEFVDSQPYPERLRGGERATGPARRGDRRRRAPSAARRWRSRSWTSRSSAAAWGRSWARSSPAPPTSRSSGACRSSRSPPPAAPACRRACSR